MESNPVSSRLAAALLFAAVAASAPGQVITFNDDGGWCWFQDERAIVERGVLIFGSVAAGARDPSRRGDIELTVYDLATGRLSRVELDDRLLAPGHDSAGVYDDHNAPALAVRKDGRVLAVWAMHGPENRFYYRVTKKPRDARNWQPRRSFTPSESSRITYSNLHVLKREKDRIYNFYRGLDNSFKPSYAWSDDGGETWRSGSVLIDVPVKYRHRPYAKYASNGEDTVHILYTEGHPRNFDNSVYHVFYRDGILHRSDGAPIRSLAEGLKDPTEGTRVFQGDPNNVAWVSDVHIDAKGRPWGVYSVQKDSAGLPAGRGGEDHRYRYARWNGSTWVDFEIARAGSRLYAGEDDYTGNIALDPEDPDTVYISTNADPVSGKPLVSAKDGRRHYEIYRGRTKDSGATWAWTPLTTDSSADNIRPIVPKWNGAKVVVLWLRGRYETYTNYDLAVVGIVADRR